MKKILLCILCAFFPVGVLAENDTETIITSFSQKAEDIILEKGEDQREFIIYILKEFSERSDVRPETSQSIQLLIKKIEENKGKILWSQEFKDNNIDIESVKSRWIGWINEERELLGVPFYSYDTYLEKTALAWSRLAKKKGVLDHKVSPSDSYYDYNKKAKWMKDHGVVCKNISRITFSESIGWGIFSCNDDDCTDELIDAIRGSFDFFMSEKGKTYKPHYEAIAMKLFSTMGLGIELENISGNRYKYYLTNHYCTQVQ